jgi:hypothetical protein
MVHALREIWRVLIPGGHLIDLRPRATNWPLEVVADGQVMLAGKVDNAPFVPDDSAAESAIQRTVREGLFSPENQVSFDCASYWDTLEGMLAYQAESDNPSLTVPDDVLVKAHEFSATAHQHSKVRIRLSMDLVKYRKPGPKMEE